MEVHVEEADMQLVSQLSALTGETETEAIRLAVQERLNRLVSDDHAAYMARIRAITSRVAAMPILDARDPDDIIGYNENGTFD